MVKTIRGTVEFEQLRGLLVEHARKLPDYTKVVSENFVAELGTDRIMIRLQERKEIPCYSCDESEADPDCYWCKGTGKTTEYVGVSVNIIPKQYPHGEKLAIQVNTEGKDITKWKPDVERIKEFIEGLVGEPCVVIPMSKKEKLENQPPLEDTLQASLDQLKNQS